MRSDVVTHRRVFAGVLALPPLQVVEIAAEQLRRGFYGSNAKAISKGLTALTADTSADLLRINAIVPGNSMVSIFVKARCVDGANGLADASVPVLAVRPVIDGHRQPANLAVRHLLFVGQRVAPDPAVAAIEAAGAAIIRAAIGHLAQSPRR